MVDLKKAHEKINATWVASGFMCMKFQKIEQLVDPDLKIVNTYSCYNSRTRKKFG
jgi:hypothetical protein